MLSEYLTISDAVDCGIIPKDYAYELIMLHKCNCGSPIVVNRALTEIVCSNPNCRYKLAGRYMKSISIFNLKGYGSVYFSDYIYTYCITNIVDALLSPLSEKLFNNWRSVSHSSDVILKMLSLPGIESATSASIFEKYADFNELKTKSLKYGMYKFLTTNGMSCNDKLLDMLKIAWDKENRTLSFDKFQEFCSRLKSNNTVVVNNYEELDDYILSEGLYYCIFDSVGGSGKEASNIVDVFKTYWEDIVRMFSLCKVRYKCKLQLKIVITGDITSVHKTDGSSFNREEFVQYLNDRYNDFGIEISNGKARKSCMFIVADYPTSNASYIEGMMMNKIIDSARLIGVLETYADKVKKGEITC